MPSIPPRDGECPLCHVALLLWNIFVTLFVSHCHALYLFSGIITKELESSSSSSSVNRRISTLLLSFIILYFVLRWHLMTFHYIYFVLLQYYIIVILLTTKAFLLKCVVSSSLLLFLVVYVHTQMMNNILDECLRPRSAWLTLHSPPQFDAEETKIAAH